MRKRTIIPERIGSLDNGGKAFEGDRQFVTALYRGLELLRCFKPGDEGLGNLELSQRTGLGPSTVSRLTYTLMRLGYLSYNEKTARYKLGVAALELGYSCLARYGIRRIAQPLMQDAADEIGGGLVFALSVRDKLHMTYIAMVRSEGVMTLQMDVGARLAIEYSTAGKAYLAAAPEEELAQIMQDLRLARSEEEFPKIAASIYQAINEVREHGYVMSLGSWHPDINAIGVPFATSQDRSIVYSMTCGGVAYLLPKERMIREGVPLLQNLVAEISRRCVGS